MLKRIASATLALVIAIPAWAGPTEDKALWDAAVSHNVEALKDALKRGANPNAPSPTGRPVSPLEAASIGSWHHTRDRAEDIAKNETAAKLSQAGMGDEEIDRYLAVEMSKVLFSAGAKVSRSDIGALFFAIANGNAELVALLIDKGASATGRIEGYTPTELAKKYDHEAVYQLLVARGGSPLDGRSSAQLAFVEAARNGDVKAMEREVKNGDRVNDFDTNKKTALTEAVGIPIYEWGQVSAIFWLLDHGADPNPRNTDDLPLHVFVRANQYTLGQPEKRVEVKALAETMLRRLMEAGAKASGADTAGRTPLHIAAKYDNVRAAEVLIEQGAKVMPRDGLGKTPLDYAETSSMIKLLKQNGATEQ